MANFSIIFSDMLSHEEYFKKFHEVSKQIINLIFKKVIDFKLHLFSIFTHF